MPTSSRSCAQHQKASCGVPTACQFGAGGAGVRPSTSGPAPAPCPLPRAALQQIPPPPETAFLEVYERSGSKGRAQAEASGTGAAAKRRRFPPLATHPARPASHTGSLRHLPRTDRALRPQITLRAPPARAAHSTGLGAAAPRGRDGTGRADPAGLGRRRLWRGARCPGPAGARREVPVPVSAPVPVPVPLLIPRRRWRLRR